MSTCQRCHAGKRILIARAGTEGNSVLLEVWDSDRILQEFAVPKDLHGSILNEAWFSNGAAWTADESRVAYVAEVRRAVTGCLCIRSQHQATLWAVLLLAK